MPPFFSGVSTIRYSSRDMLDIGSPENGILQSPISGMSKVRRLTPSFGQSVICSLISSELAFNSGAYIALAFVGRALNFPGISARIR